MAVKSAVPRAKREQLLRFLLQFHVDPFDESATLACGQVPGLAVESWYPDPRVRT